jgi:hypothetical protein
MDINFIVTCHNREDYLPYLEEVFKSYKKIVPHYFICYNGNKSYFPCHLKMDNIDGWQSDSILTKMGYELSLYYNDFPRFVKIGIDTFLLREDKIIEIFKQLEEKELPCASQQWEMPGITLYSDVFFCDTRFGNIFRELPYDKNENFERKLDMAVKKIGKGYLPILREFSKERDLNLGWVFSHAIEQNAEAFKNFKLLLFEAQKDMEIKKSDFLEKLKKIYYYTKGIWKN